MIRLRAALTTLLLGFLLAGPAVANDKVYYYSGDTLQSEVVITDASRNVVERTYYAPYGQVLNRALRDGPGYTGHEEDPETSLVYMQQRYFDPASGRFLSSDPVATTNDGAGFNRYAYANDNPYRYTDPTGMETGIAYHAEWMAEGGHTVPNSPDDAAGPLIIAGGETLGAAVAGQLISALTEDVAVAYRAYRFESRLNQVRNILKNWKETPNRKGAGSRFENPSNKGDRVRVDRGNPDHQLPSQRVDHVVEQRNGRTVDRNGEPINAEKPAKTPEAHIPLVQWIKDHL